MLHPDVCGGSYEGIVAVHSLSKRSNLAGYRAAFLAGDAGVLGDLLQIRKHGGMMTPAPVQAATVAALGDDAHVAEQRERYTARRTALRGALEAAGFRIEHSEASLYLWATRDESVLGHGRRPVQAAASSSRRATSTARRASASSASRSRRRTSASARRCGAWAE